jgi:hypothetical protein
MAPDRASIGVPVGHTPYSWHHSVESSTPPGHTVFSWGEPTSVSASAPCEAETDEAGRRLAALLQELEDCDVRLSALEAKDNESPANTADATAAPAFFPPETQWLRFGNCSATVAPGSKLDSAIVAANNAKATQATAAAKEASLRPSPPSQPTTDPEPKSVQPEKASPPQPEPEPEPQPEIPEKTAPQPTPEPAPEPTPEPKQNDLVWVDDGAFVGCMECQGEFWLFH